MTRKHDAIFDDVLSDFATPSPEAGDRSSARFLKRSTTIGDRLSGDLEEKTLQWVDPESCRMWDRHNREYDLLTEDNCRDLIDGIRSQGRQEFPAIVRPSSEPGFQYEVICGARRHFAVTWLRANNYTQFKYLIEVRDLTDEEAFRLADIENRDREDISDYERALDYADAVERYYGGKQKAMAERLEVSQPWLSRYLQLAKLPAPVVQAFPTIRDLRERNARDLKPLLAKPETSKPLLAEAKVLMRAQADARGGQGRFIEPATVMKRLLRAARPTAEVTVVPPKVYNSPDGRPVLAVRQTGTKTRVEFDASCDVDALRGAFAAYLDDRDPG